MVVWCCLVCSSGSGLATTLDYTRLAGWWFGLTVARERVVVREGEKTSTSRHGRCNVTFALPHLTSNSSSPPSFFSTLLLLHPPSSPPSFFSTLSCLSCPICLSVCNNYSIHRYHTIPYLTIPPYYLSLPWWPSIIYD